MSLGTERAYILVMVMWEELLLVKLKLEWLALIYLYQCLLPIIHLAVGKDPLFGDQHMHGPEGELDFIQN